MRIPRDISGADLVKALERLGYPPDAADRHSPAAHDHAQRRASHHGAPNHDPLRMGTLAAILASVAAHHRMTRDAVIERLLR